MLARTGAGQGESLPETYEERHAEKAFRIVVETSDISVADRVRPLLLENEYTDSLLIKSDSMRIKEAEPAPGASGPGSAARRILLDTPPAGDSLFTALRQRVWAIVDPECGDFESHLLCALEKVANGECPLLAQVASDPVASDALMSAVEPGAARQQTVTANPLSASEVEILSRIASGQTSRKIAEDLGFHLQTVKNRVTAIMNKTNANSRGHAAMIAQSNGWIRSHPQR